MLLVLKKAKGSTAIVVTFVRNFKKMDAFWDIMKYTLPSVVVFLTVYFMLSQYFAQERVKWAQIQQKEMFQHSLPLKLQAYERLALFLERIRIPNLMLRFPAAEATPESLCKMLMLGVQQEYEHNMVQQIYVSEKLWEIVVHVKNEVLHHLDQASTECKDKDLETLRQLLLSKVHSESSRTIDMGLEGIRKEKKLILI